MSPRTALALCALAVLSAVAGCAGGLTGPLDGSRATETGSGQLVVGVGTPDPSSNATVVNWSGSALENSEEVGDLVTEAVRTNETVRRTVEGSSYKEVSKVFFFQSDVVHRGDTDVVYLRKDETIANVSFTPAE